MPDSTRGAGTAMSAAWAGRATNAKPQSAQPSALAKKWLDDATNRLIGLIHPSLSHEVITAAHKYLMNKQNDVTQKPQPKFSYTLWLTLMISHTQSERRSSETDCPPFHRSLGRHRSIRLVPIAETT